MSGFKKQRATLSVRCENIEHVNFRILMLPVFMRSSEGVKVDSKIGIGYRE